MSACLGHMTRGIDTHGSPLQPHVRNPCTLSSLEGNRRGLKHTSPSAGYSTTFFFVVFLVAVVAVNLVWRVELRVARADVVTGLVPSSSPRFLLGDTQDGAQSDHGSTPWTP